MAWHALTSLALQRLQSSQPVLYTLLFFPVRSLQCPRGEQRSVRIAVPSACRPPCSLAHARLPHFPLHCFVPSSSSVFHRSLCPIAPIQQSNKVRAGGEVWCLVAYSPSRAVGGDAGFAVACLTHSTFRSMHGCSSRCPELLAVSVAELGPTIGDCSSPLLSIRKGVATLSVMTRHS